MKITLTVIEGPNRGQTFSFDDHDTFIVGRSRAAHLRIPPKDGYFSRNHFMVEVNPPLCRLFDMASRNGTFVNNERVEEVDLRDGDLIHGGKTTIRVRLESSAPNEATNGNGAKNNVQTIGWTRVSPRQRTPLGRLAEFELLRELGRGGMGIVYLATRRNDRQQVAVKTITCNGPATQSDIQRFLREASILRELRHPNVVRFYDFGESEGQVYLSMEYVPGQDAQRLLDELGPLSIPRATHLTCELLRALAFAHSRGFVHRDIKPANVLVFQKQGKERAKLSDFGLARVYQDSRLSGLTMQGQMGGSLAFIPPEQITNYRDVQPASDLYSVAASLYTLLTGCYLYDFPDQFSKRLLKILQDAPVPILARRRDLPRRLAAIIHRGLKRDPAARFASATAMRQALLPYTSGETA